MAPALVHTIFKKSSVGVEDSFATDRDEQQDPITITKKASKNAPSSSSLTREGYSLALPLSSPEGGSERLL